MNKMAYLSTAMYKIMLRIPFRMNSYYRHKYSSEVETAVNEQIKAELQAAHSYLSMAVALLHPSVSRPGAGGFFMRMYHEELKHAEEFIQYQLRRGGFPLVKELCTPTWYTKMALDDAFKQALDMEHSVTKLLENLICIAESAKDYHCANFVTSVFMEDQMDCINNLAGHITEISRICDNEDGVWNYDLHLAVTYPYKYKSLKK